MPRLSCLWSIRSSRWCAGATAVVGGASENGRRRAPRYPVIDAVRRGPRIAMGSEAWNTGAVTVEPGQLSRNAIVWVPRRGLALAPGAIRGSAIPTRALLSLSGDRTRAFAARPFSVRPLSLCAATTCVCRSNPPETRRVGSSSSLYSVRKGMTRSLGRPMIARPRLTRTGRWSRAIRSDSSSMTASGSPT